MARPFGTDALRVLILGGTGEARALAQALAGRTDIAASVSLAGRTRNPLALPTPVRSGGFGGTEGLAAHLRDQRIDALVDATHPFAAAISRNAEQAARATGTPRLVLARPAWAPQPGDRWLEASSIPEAVRLLGEAPRRVFVALGRNEVHAVEAALQHVYLVRSVDPVEPPLDVPDARYIEARGPFVLEEERALFLAHGITAVLAKNSGGQASYAKIEAARALGIEVFIVARPPRPPGESVETAEEALAWIEAARAHHAAPAARRGV